MLMMKEPVAPMQITPAGAEIPIPNRDDVMAALRKVAKAPEPDEQLPDLQ